VAVGLTYWAVARYTYAWSGMVTCAGGTAGNAAVFPSRACSEVYCAGVNVTPAGLSGPVTPVNSPLALS
jgi:hypothetical protein